MNDEEQIRRVLALYCHYIDERNKEAYVELFSRDTRLINVRAVRVGHAGIWDHINSVYTRWPEGLRMKHFLGASEVTVDGDTGEAISDVVVFECNRESSWSIRQTGRYFDKLIREDGEWRIAERRIETDGFMLDTPVSATTGEGVRS